MGACEVDGEEEGEEHDGGGGPEGAVERRIAQVMKFRVCAVGDDGAASDFRATTAAGDANHALRAGENSGGDAETDDNRRGD